MSTREKEKEKKEPIQEKPMENTTEQMTHPTSREWREQSATVENSK